MGPLAQEFLTIAGLHWLAVASPGPDFALILRQSVRHGRRTATWSAVGIGSGILVHVAYTVVGLGLVIRNSPFAFQLMHYACAAYLAWLGWRALRAAPRRGAAHDEVAGRSRTKDEDAMTPRPAAAFATGFFTNALNPKATLFFLSIFSVVVSPATPASVQAGYGLWMAAATAGWFTVVGWFFTQTVVRRWFLRWGHWFDRATGALLIALAIRVALSSAP